MDTITYPVSIYLVGIVKCPKKPSVRQSRNMQTRATIQWFLIALFLLFSSNKASI
jgi:hypothetical protein